MIMNANCDSNVSLLAAKVLKTESEEIWKSMETAERTLSEMVGCQDFDTTRFFVEEDRAAAAAAAAGGHRESDTLLLKQKNDRKETEDFYMNVSCWNFSKAETITLVYFLHMCTTSFIS